jgi:hypothetical protein
MIKTVSLETAKLLKDAGFEHQCDFWWESIKGMTETKWMLCFKGDHQPYLSNLIELIKAPTADELLEELPTDQYEIYIGNDCKQYHIGFNRAYGHHSEQQCRDSYFADSSLVEAVAKLWLWLKKENLLKSPNAD